MTIMLQRKSTVDFSVASLLDQNHREVNTINEEFSGPEVSKEHQPNQLNSSQSLNACEFHRYCPGELSSHSITDYSLSGFSNTGEQLASFNCISLPGSPLPNCPSWNANNVTSIAISPMQFRPETVEMDELKRFTEYLYREFSRTSQLTFPSQVPVASLQTYSTMPYLSMLTQLIGGQATNANRSTNFSPSVESRDLSPLYRFSNEQQSRESQRYVTIQRGTSSRGMLRRAVFTDFQRRGLEMAFGQHAYIAKPDRKALADQLGLKDAQVKIWFQNRRMKWRSLQQRTHSGTKHDVDVNKLPTAVSADCVPPFDDREGKDITGEKSLEQELQTGPITQISTNSVDVDGLTSDSIESHIHSVGNFKMNRWNRIVVSSNSSQLECVGLSGIHSALSHSNHREHVTRLTHEFDSADHWLQSSERNHLLKHLM